MTHGTNYAYVQGCRCEPCREAARVRQVQYRSTEAGEAAVSRYSTKRYQERKTEHRCTSCGRQMMTLRMCGYCAFQQADRTAKWRAKQWAIASFQTHGQRLASGPLNAWLCAERNFS